jgi:hypothetical protein
MGRAVESWEHPTGQIRGRGMEKEAGEVDRIFTVRAREQVLKRKVM